MSRTTPTARRLSLDSNTLTTPQQAPPAPSDRRLSLGHNNTAMPSNIPARANSHESPGRARTSRTLSKSPIADRRSGNTLDSGTSEHRACAKLAPSDTAAMCSPASAVPLGHRDEIPTTATTQRHADADADTDPHRRRVRFDSSGAAQSQAGGKALQSLLAPLTNALPNVDQQPAAEWVGTAGMRPEGGAEHSLFDDSARSGAAAAPRRQSRAFSTTGITPNDRQPAQRVCSPDPEPPRHSEYMNTVYIDFAQDLLDDSFEGHTQPNRLYPQQRSEVVALLGSVRRTESNQSVGSKLGTPVSNLSFAPLKRSPADSAGDSSLSFKSRCSEHSCRTTEPCEDTFNLGSRRTHVSVREPEELNACAWGGRSSLPAAYGSADGAAVTDAVTDTVTDMVLGGGSNCFLDSYETLRRDLEMNDGELESSGRVVFSMEMLANAPLHCFGVSPQKLA